jgi:phage terminase small subunit
VEIAVSGKKLTPRQATFVEEYLKDLNATQAAIRAGYAERTANREGSRLLSNVDIAATIAEGQAKRSARTKITADRVLTEFARMGFIDLGTLFKGGSLLAIETLDKDDRAGITGLEVVTRRKGEGEVEYVAKVKTDKGTALLALARHLGLDKLTIQDQRVDWTKLRTETIKMIAEDLGFKG